MSTYEERWNAAWGFVKVLYSFELIDDLTFYSKLYSLHRGGAY